MPKLTTKHKILAAAVQLFNRDGLINVRLQQIADESVVSIGNMTYHFRTKEIIVQAIWEELVAQQQRMLAEFRIVPLFEDIERQIQSAFQLQQQYVFFYLDTLEVIRAFPNIRDLHRQHIQWQVQQIETMIHFNTSRGVFVINNSNCNENQLAQQYWMTCDMWLNRQATLGNDLSQFKPFRDALWALLTPYMTDMGRMEFRQLNELILKELI